jgi:hypothetical protein
MLTGHMPFQGDSPAAIMLKQLKSRAVPPSRSRPEVSPALDEFVVLKCLSRNVRARFQTVESAVEALDRCIEPAPAERRRSRGLWRPLLGVAVLAAAGAGTLVHLAWRLTAADAPESVNPSRRRPLASLSPIPRARHRSPRRRRALPRH